MTDEKRPIRQISRNMQEFQAAICELVDAVAGSARITAYSELGDGSIPTSGLPTTRPETPRVLLNVARVMDEERYISGHCFSHGAHPCQ
jgi:hypothetical protein